MELKQTALHGFHKKANAIMRPFGGWEMPIHYGSITEEHQAVRQAAGLFDVSHMCKFMLCEEAALLLLLHLLTNDAAALQVGEAQYTCLTNEQGGMIDDAVLYRLGKTRYLLVANAANHEKNWTWIQKKNQAFGATLEDWTTSHSIIALQGPLSQVILEQITDTALNAIPFYKFGKGVVADIENVLISHTGYTGEPGYELYVANEHALSIWEALMEAGSESYGLRPIGLGARDTLRLEMGYCLYGQDIDETTSPIEAGLGWITKFNHTFVACEYLQRQKLQGAPKRLVGLLMENKQHIPRAGYHILNEREMKVGEVTSGGFSISLQRGIGMGYVATAHSKAGTKLQLKIREQLHPVEVVKRPIWKRK